MNGSENVWVYAAKAIWKNLTATISMAQSKQCTESHRASLNWNWPIDIVQAECAVLLCL